VVEHGSYDAADGCFIVDDEDSLLRHFLEAPLRDGAFFVIGGVWWGFNFADFFCAWWRGEKAVFSGGFGEWCAQNVVFGGWLAEKSVASMVSGRLLLGF
jgi:hypothetical protein